MVSTVMGKDYIYVDNNATGQFNISVGHRACFVEVSKTSLACIHVSILTWVNKTVCRRI